MDSGQRLGDFGSQAVALGDLDGGGALDALVGNSSSLRDALGTTSRDEPNTVWLNDGAGHFTDSGQALGNSHTRYAALGDLDGDGDLDALTDSERGGQVWLNDGLGNFTSSRQDLSHASDCASAIGDVDGDGDLDIVAGCLERTTRVWLNDGTGDFKTTQR